MTSQTNTPVPAIIYKLVETFEQNLAAYHSSKNETELRREFLDKFFAALGWDVSNEKGYDERRKEVVHEFSVEVAGKGKKADYAFRARDNKNDKFDFLVEAKKPSVKVESSPDAAFQLRRYGWSAKLPINILTDFEHLAVYDCRAMPNHNDPATVGRIKLIHYQEYVNRWPELVEIFSPEAVRQGSLAQYAAGLKGKKGAADVDDAFLEEIERWRELLARNIALRNKDIDIAGLNYTVQMTIDRIVFLRICEEREIEPENQLQNIALTPCPSPGGRGVRGEGAVYQALCELFKRADTKYNSGLFHFKNEKGQSSQPDDLTLALEIDDKVLKDIILNLYLPKSPYAFLYIPADILGQVYERFLGKVIRLTAGHQAKVEEKPEVRKAGGVYYTPTYIVDYIVKNTVGQLVDPLPLGEGKVRGITPKEVAALKIVDPACGSGTFLLGAYQYLLDWHLNWYADPANEPRKWEKNGAITRFLPSPQGRGDRREGGEGGYRLSTAKKKEILLNNIFGVDIDAQAVEVTKLSLLLKVLENAGGQLSLGLDRVLPDLGNNIKCGNSLIGFDYFDGQLFPDEAERARVNPFDWQSEFKNVFAKGGFDAVIGNPPYGAELDSGQIKYLKNELALSTRSLDTYEAFLVKGKSILAPHGRIGMIIPASWLTGETYHESRKKLVESLSPIVAYAMPFDVFEAAYIDTAIVIFAKDTNNPSALVHFFPKKEKLTEIPLGIGTLVDVASVRQDDLHRLTIALSQSNAPILKKLKSVPLTFGDWFEIQRGVQPYSRSKHTETQIKNKFLHSPAPLSNEYIPELQGNELARYWTASERVSFLRYCDQIASTRSMKMFQGNRLVLRRLLTRKFRLQASMVSETMITTDNVLNGIPKSEHANVAFALGILNSRVISWLYVNTSMIAQKDDFPQVHISALKNLPIPLAEKAQHDKMVSLVEQMLTLHKNLPAAKTPQEKERLKRQVEATDRAIDTLVYALYGLNEAEIRIVEEG